MTVKFTGTTLTRYYRDSTGEQSSASFGGDDIAADGSNYQEVVTALRDALNAFELWQHDDVTLIKETISTSLFFPNASAIPTDPEVQREKVILMTFSDLNGNTFQRSIPCVDFSKVTLGGGNSDEISLADPTLVAIKALFTVADDPYLSPYGAEVFDLVNARVGGRNN